MKGHKTISAAQASALSFIEQRPGYIGRAQATVRSLARQGFLEYKSETLMAITEDGLVALAAWRETQEKL